VKTNVTVPVGKVTAATLASVRTGTPPLHSDQTDVAGPPPLRHQPGPSGDDLEVCAWRRELGTESEARIHVMPFQGVELPS
jgi:hypothetical protein